jgi:hypothetical protein
VPQSLYEPLAKRYTGPVSHSGSGLRVVALAFCIAGSAVGGSGVAHATPPESAAPARPPGARTSASRSGQRVRVFYSGHSLLDNPLPDWVESIAASRGDSVGWDEQIVLGSPIRVRTKGEDPEAAGFPGYQLGKGKNGGIDVLRELRSPTQLAPGEKYERLVITERTDLLGTIKWENTTGYLRHFHDRLIEQNASAGSLLYECWPEIDKQDPSAWLAYVERELFGWECVAAQVNDSLSSAGRADRVEVLPGGIALSALVKLALAGGVPGVVGTPEQRLGAIFADDVHLTPLGVYLLAALHYAALFGKTPVGAAGAPGVSAEALPILQRIAWDTLSSYRARAQRAPLLAECRTRIANELCPAYHRFHGKPENIAQCKSWASPDSPFAGALPEQPHPVRAKRSAAVGWGSGLAALLLVGLAYGWKRQRA